MNAESYQSTTTRLTREEASTCALIEDLLPLYIEGEVSPTSRDTIVEHVARCDRCAGFLAGAQRVRAQFRRDGTQRNAIVVNALPEQNAMGGPHLIATAIAAFCCCLVGGVSSLQFWNNLRSGSSPEVLFAAVVAVGVFGMLIALGRGRGPMTLNRLVSLAAGCVLGALGTLPLVADTGPGGQLLGLCLGIVGLGGVWLAIWKTNPSGAVSDSRPLWKLRRYITVSALLLLAASSYVILSFTVVYGVGTRFWASGGAVALLVLGLGLLHRSSPRQGDA